MMNLEQCEIKQLKQENEQLRAHVERLTSEAIRLGDIIGGQDRHILNRLLDEAPTQSLQQIKRDAVLEAVEKSQSEFLAYVKEYEFTENQRKFILMGVRAFRCFLNSHANNLVKGGE